MAAVVDSTNQPETNLKPSNDQLVEKDDNEGKEEAKIEESKEKRQDEEKSISSMMIDESFNDTKVELEEPLASIQFDRFIELKIDALPAEIFDEIFASNKQGSFLLKRHKMRESENLEIGEWFESHTLDNELDINENDHTIKSNSQSNMVYYSHFSKSDSNLKAHYLLKTQPKVYKRIVTFVTKVINAPKMGGWLPTTTDIFETNLVRFWGKKRFLLVNWCSTSGLPYSKHFMVLHRYEFEQISDNESLGSVSVGFYWIKPSWLRSVVEYGVANQTKKELTEYLETIQEIFAKKKEEKEEQSKHENDNDKVDSGKNDQTADNDEDENDDDNNDKQEDSDAS